MSGLLNIHHFITKYLFFMNSESSDDIITVSLPIHTLLRCSYAMNDISPTGADHLQREDITTMSILLSCCRRFMPLACNNYTIRVGTR